MPALWVLLVLAVAAPLRAGERQIFPAPESAEADIAAALQTAAATHKRVVLDFGGNWCADCQVLDIFLHDSANRPILEANYVLVHVNIGQLDRNLDIAARYGIPISKGVPALAVLSEHGELLYSRIRGHEAHALESRDELSRAVEARKSGLNRLDASRRFCRLWACCPRSAPWRAPKRQHPRSRSCLRSSSSRLRYRAAASTSTKFRAMCKRCRPRIYRAADLRA
jgi:thiol-disulfide isomerase/thioredoxin